MPLRTTNKFGFSTKRCPFCSADLPLNAYRCGVCGKRVGAIDRQGRAKRPIDWYGYTACIFSFLLLGWFVWWAFFK
ncbi:MAG: hypothetical protein RBT11_11435 [Desulfobacterales bacterium]|nr:hypothetical protein [Desulfobacterales bacterium]